MVVAIVPCKYTGTVPACGQLKANAEPAADTSAKTKSLMHQDRFDMPCGQQWPDALSFSFTFLLSILGAFVGTPQLLSCGSRNRCLEP